MRPKLGGLRLVSIYVDHPVEDLRVPAAADLGAGVFRRFDFELRF
ncbi:MAG: hypothetical protein ACRD5M_00040 [Candidatus Acidiferrales bacterium]